MVIGMGSNPGGGWYVIAFLGIMLIVYIVKKYKKKKIGDD